MLVLVNFFFEKAPSLYYLAYKVLKFPEMRSSMIRVYNFKYQYSVNAVHRIVAIQHPHPLTSCGNKTSKSTCSSPIIAKCTVHRMKYNTETEHLHLPSNLHLRVLVKQF